jgi:hypothetical protein
VGRVLEGALVPGGDLVVEEFCFFFFLLLDDGVVEEVFEEGEAIF